MGGKRRKATAGPIKKASKYKIPSRFDCPLCDAKSSIAVQIFRSTGEATVYCRTCKVGLGRRWRILPLEKGVDVFFRFREELMNLDRQYLEAQEMEGMNGYLTESQAANDLAGSNTIHGAADNKLTHNYDNITINDSNTIDNTSNMKNVANTYRSAPVAGATRQVKNLTELTMLARAVQQRRSAEENRGKTYISDAVHTQSFADNDNNNINRDVTTNYRPSAGHQEIDIREEEVYQQQQEQVNNDDDDDAIGDYHFDPPSPSDEDDYAAMFE